MSRPNVKTERREQILDAFEVCVARYGIEGATLAKTAEQAGLARALIRHNIGNREELLEALVTRFLANSHDSMTELIDDLPRKNRLRSLVDWLFDPDYFDPQVVQVSNALIAASSEDPELARRMQAWRDDFLTQLQAVIAEEHPQAKPAQVAAVGAGLMGIYFNVEALNPLGEAETLTEASKDAVLLLLTSLETG